MTISATIATAQSVGAAVHRHSRVSRQGLLERTFSLAFRDLVYAQIWEDPVIDMEALEIRPDSAMVSIASGGCNLLSYLTAGPALIHAVDLNAAHVALCRLKIAALTALPGHDEFYRFVGEGNAPSNVPLFDRVIAPRLDAQSLSYWNNRDLRGRRRVSAYGRNIYRAGLLGRFIRLAHGVARVHGVDPSALAVHRTKGDMQRAFDDVIAPLFDKPLIKRVLDHPASLYGLGIPPAQFDALSKGGPRMAAIVRERLRKLLCDFDLDRNYFAEQALTGCYRPGQDGALPPYLERRHFDTLRDRAGRISIRRVSFTEFLRTQSDQSLDRYVLLDAQDWMTPTQLNELWTEITRTARPQSRVIFRTADSGSVLPGRIAPELLRAWTYHESRSLDLFRRDRSAIYGGFHLYTRAP